MVMTTVLFVFSSCGKTRQTDAEQQKAEDAKIEMFESLVTEAWESKDEHLLPVIDSLEAAGELSSARADFVRGVTYDRSRHVKQGERYYTKVYETVDPEVEGWDFYLRVADRVSQIRMTMNNQKGAPDFGDASPCSHVRLLI